jgi:serine protease DegS
LIDSSGRLIGINTLIRSTSGGSEGIGLAIPSTNALEIISDLIQYGEVRRGWLGFSIDKQNLIKHRRLLISEVIEDGPAFIGGLKKNDIIYSINSEDSSYENLFKAFARSKPGEEMVFEVEREEEIISLVLTAGNTD